MLCNISMVVGLSQLQLCDLAAPISIACRADRRVAAVRAQRDSRYMTGTSARPSRHTAVSTHSGRRRTPWCTPHGRGRRRSRRGRRARSARTHRCTSARASSADSLTSRSTRSRPPRWRRRTAAQNGTGAPKLRTCMCVVYVKVQRRIVMYVCMPCVHRTHL